MLKGGNWLFGKEINKDLAYSGLKNIVYKNIKRPNNYIRIIVSIKNFHDCKNNWSHANA